MPAKPSADGVAVAGMVSGVCCWAACSAASAPALCTTGKKSKWFSVYLSAIVPCRSLTKMIWSPVLSLSMPERPVSVIVIK
mgnify:CR=1 FL=1